VQKATFTTIALMVAVVVSIVFILCTVLWYRRRHPRTNTAGTADKRGEYELTTQTMMDQSLSSMALS